MFLRIFSGGVDPLIGVFWIVGLLFAITVHEFMHAWTANYFGDPTAKYMGRVTLNPIAHLDPIGTLAILFLPIGWGKPVPVNEANFRNRRKASAIVSLAGPLSNLFVAFVFSIFLRFGLITNEYVQALFLVIIIINIFLLVFNLIPIPPLDGSKILYYFLPRNINIQQLEAYGPFILLMLLFLTGGVFISLISSAASFILSILGVSGSLF